MIQSCLRNQCQELLKAPQHRNHLSVMASVKSKINPFTVCGGCEMNWGQCSNFPQHFFFLFFFNKNVKAVFIMLILKRCCSFLFLYLFFGSLRFEVSANIS